MIEVNSDKWLNLKDLPHEIWKDIEGFEGFYQISNYGRVKSLIRKTRNGSCKNEKIIKARIDKKGYNHYALRKYGKVYERKAHRLVAKAYILNPENKPQVNHLDANRLNNYYKNLEWCTNSENQIHSYITNPNKKNFFRDNNPKKNKICTSDYAGNLGNSVGGLQIK